MVSPWQSPQGRVAAFMDIGTNSIRLLLVRINPNHTYTILSDQKETVRLGEGEFVDQRLRPEAMQRAVLVCKNFAEMARSNGAEDILAVATSATREAENRDEFTRRLKREANLEVHTVSGMEEARLIYLGVVNGVHLGDRQALFIDIGGGSTEVILGDQNEYHHLDSLKLGAIRLTSLFFLPTEMGPVHSSRYALIQQYVRNTDVRTVQAISGAQVEIAYGSSGTIENLADIAIAHFHKRSRTRDDGMTHSQLKEVVEMLCSLPLEERRKVPGINPGRADIIVAGAAILDTLMEDFQIPEIYISERGLRDGLLIDYLSRTEHAAHYQGVSVRERSILNLARACGVDEPHARHVAQLALELFDSAAEIKLHSFDGRERELLEYSALVHDVGLFLSYNNHHAHSYYLIRNSDLLGFDQTEIEIMASAGLFHRKAMPHKKRNPQYAALDKRSQRIVQLFALLLRIAESLDRSHSSLVQHAWFRRGDGKVIRLVVHAQQNPQLELWGVQEHLVDFKEVFRKELVVEAVMEAGSLAS